MAKPPQAVRPKQIVYIIGAGATQAEASHKGGRQPNLMMKDSDIYGFGISTRVRKRIKIDKKLDLVAGKFIDIEKLISLLSVCGIKKYNEHADELRKGYFEEIVMSLSKSGLLNKPDLAICLLQLHSSAKYRKIEELTGIISLNHDNLLQVASQKIFNSINLGFEFRSDEFRYEKHSNVPVIIQLHGSFNWENHLPIYVTKLTSASKYKRDILWIPPSIVKESKDYPYNKLMGLAYEVLTRQCDILRIIGCSMSQNDWNLISLIFSAQYHQYKSKNRCFRIELIMDHDRGEEIKKDYAYLKELFSIGYLKDGKFDVYKDKRKITSPSKLDNFFKYWLVKKSQYHLKNSDIDLPDIGENLRNLVEE